MSKVRVYEVAKQLNMDQKALVALFQSLGVTDVRNHMSAVEQDVVDRVKRHLERQKQPDVTEERIRPTVVKRRARPTDDVASAEAKPAVAAVAPAAASGAAAPPARASSSTAARASSTSAVRGAPPAQTPAQPTAVSAATSGLDREGPAAPAEGADAKRPASALADTSSAAAPPPSAAQARSAEGGEPPAPAKSAPASRRSSPSTERKAPSSRAASSRATARAKPVDVTSVSFDEEAASAQPSVTVVSSLPGTSQAAAEPKAVEPVSAAHAGPPASTGASPAAVTAASALPPTTIDETVGATRAPSPTDATQTGATQTGATQTAAAGDDQKPSSATSGTGKAGSAKPDAGKPGMGKAEAAGKPSVGKPEAGVDAGKPLGPKPADRTAREAVPPAAAAPAVRPGDARSADARGPARGPTSGTPSAAPARSAVASQPPARGEPARTDASARPSTPPRTGIDVWQGRPGVPMPVPPRSSTPPGPRRTTYDPRAGAGGARPPQPAPYGAARPGQSFGPNRGGTMQRQPFGKRGPQMPMGMAGRKPPINTPEMASHKKVIKIEEQVSLQTLALRMGIRATEVLMKLLSLGMTGVHINSTLDADTAKILASEFGWTVEDVAIDESTVLTAAMTDSSDPGGEQLPRPPIVTVMGHVDHGKTSLLDRIRKATVADGEAGGITQHIGAYRVDTPRGTIAFLDTPGHEAFTAMRARGASVTDIVILVVAADDGVMPQTREAISHAQAAKVPIVVAVNKIDKPGAEPDKIKRDLANLGLQPEEWGGDTMFASVSAKTGQGIDHLLEGVLLQAEVLELRANPKKRASGTVIESLLDRGRGPVARVLVLDGTLHVGDVILAGGAWGKVRAMTDEFGRAVGEAGPATPVEVLGLNEVPSAGDPVHGIKDARTAEEIAETRRKKQTSSLIRSDARVTLEEIGKRLSEVEQFDLKLIVKADVQGSVEALAHAFGKLTNPRVRVTIVHSGVGGITESDVNLAVASKGIIVGFNVRPAGKAGKLAETEGVQIRLYNIIYNAVDDIKAAMEGLLPATRVEKLLGRAEVRQLFKLAKSGLVAGCMVTNGLVKRMSEARVLREGAVVWSGKLSGLRRFKDDAKDVAEGFECGISLDGFSDLREKDVIECFEVEEIKTKLF
jgi:translation initiation factor IF-2